MNTFGAKPPADNFFKRSPDGQKFIHIHPGIDSHLIHHHYHVLGGNQTDNAGVRILFSQRACQLNSIISTDPVYLYHVG